MICLLSSVALAPCAIASAYAQTVAPAPAATGGGAQSGSETRAMDGTTMPGPTTNGTGGITAPTIRLSGFRFTASTDASETYTTNALGIPSGLVSNYSGSDLLTTISLNFDLHDHTPRVDADLGYSLSGLIYTSNPSYDRVYNTLNGLAKVTLVPDRLLFNATAFAAPILVNGLGPQAAAGPNSGIRDTYGYSISPDLMFRLGDFARSDTVLTQSSVFFVLPNGATITDIVPGAPAVPDQLMTYAAVERLSSGPDFYRFNWLLTGSYVKSEQPGLDFQDSTATANLRYAFSHAIIGVAILGYDNITSDQNLNESLAGPTAMGGVQLAPTRDLQIDATAGWQFNSPSYQGDLRYQIGPFTSLIGAVTDTVTPPASRLLGNLGNLGVNNAGQFINTGLDVTAGIPPGVVSGVSGFNPSPLDGAALAATIVRYRSANLAMVHIAERTQFRFSVFHTDYSTLTQIDSTIFSPQGNSTGLDFVVTRSISPYLSASIEATYMKADDFGNKYSLYSSLLNLNYLLGPKTSAYFLVSYNHRSSGTALSATSPLSADFSTAQITIGLHRQLF
jgi:uncharacterized protein (PEP-CTERM system associated)